MSRYRTVKAADAFSTRKSTKPPKRAYDLPPDEEQCAGSAKSGRAKRRQERLWAREAVGKDDYMAFLESGGGGGGGGAAAKVTLEPRRKDESQKAFERRLKDDSMRLVKASNDRNSSTKAKKREFLKQRKAAKKQNKAGKAAPRPADDDGEPSAPAPGAGPAFGDRADAPPDLKHLAHAAKSDAKKRAKAPQDGASKAELRAARAAFVAPSLGGWERGRG